MKKQPGIFEIKDTDLMGRIGRLYTKSGVVETPAFLPVIDVFRQELPPNEIMNVEFNQVITNAYLTYKRFGEQAASKGIHRIIGFNGIVMTDSGAYQILEYGEVSVSQKEIIIYQQKIGSDIAVILDAPTKDTSKESVERSVEVTLERAKEAIPLIQESQQVWVLPVQGAAHLDILEKSAKESLRLESSYQMLGLGGLTIFMENYDYVKVVEALLMVRKILPLGKPLHLFGAGHPLIITIAAALGADTFDSASYILYARDDRYITDYGVERLDRLDYFPCNCPVCSKYTPQELLEMPREERVRLLALHNLYAIKKAVNRVKQAIKEGRLWELLEELSRKHPSAYEALKLLEEHAEFLEEVSPRTKGVVRGIKLYGEESQYHPRIQSYKKKLEKYLQGRRVEKIILIPYPEDPNDCARAYDENILTAYYVPFLGLVPSELCGIYPTIHFSYPRYRISRSVIEDTAKYIVNLLARVFPSKPVIVRDKESSPLGEMLARELH